MKNKSWQQQGHLYHCPYNMEGRWGVQVLLVSAHAQDKCPMNTGCINPFYIGLPSFTYPGIAPTNIRFMRWYLFLKATF